jgi:hypothetical protein
MEFVLLASLTCTDGKWILDGLATTSLTEVQRSELILQVLQDMPDDCSEEQYRAGSRR